MQVAVVFALSGAFLLSLRDIFGRLAMRGIDPVLGTAAIALVGQLILAVISAANGDFAQPWPGWGLPLLNISLAGVLRITIARTTLFIAIKHIGAARASSLAATNVFFAILLGQLFLEETLTLPLALGSILIVTGCVLIARSHVKVTPGDTIGDYTKGVILALTAALAFGSASVFARPAINSFASPILANFYSNAFALLCYLPLLWKRPLRSRVRTWPMQTWGLIVLVGFIVSVGTTFAYYALAHAPVVFVQPISQSRPLFVVAISWLFFQIHEQINWRVAGGAISIVTGTAMLILSY